LMTDTILPVKCLQGHHIVNCLRAVIVWMIAPTSVYVFTAVMSVLSYFLMVYTTMTGP